VNHEIVKSRGLPIAQRPIALQITPAPLVKTQVNFEEIYVKSVITFGIALMTCGAIGISAITIFGVMQLARHSVEVVD